MIFTENITIVGMKDLNQKMMKIEKQLSDISASLTKIAKVLDRQIPRPTNLRKEDDEADDAAE